MNIAHLKAGSVGQMECSLPVEIHCPFATQFRYFTGPQTCHDPDNFLSEIGLDSFFLRIYIHIYLYKHFYIYTFEYIYIYNRIYRFDYIIYTYVYIYIHIHDCFLPQSPSFVNLRIVSLLRTSTQNHFTILNHNAYIYICIFSDICIYYMFIYIYMIIASISDSNPQVPMRIGTFWFHPSKKKNPKNMSWFTHHNLRTMGKPISVKLPCT